MVATAGRTWALSIYIGNAYVAIGGLKTRSFTANNTNIDVTTADSAGRWRELLGGAGIQSLDIDFAGACQTDAAYKTLFTAVTTSALQTIRLATNGIQIDGTFLVDNLKADGPFNEAVTFEGKLLSSGQPTFTYS
jgi:TP901-1 family phage major tail protein